MDEGSIRRGGGEKKICILNYYVNERIEEGEKKIFHELFCQLFTESAVLVIIDRMCPPH
jgi:hypothetical protein